MMQSIFGLAVLLVLAWCLSENRRQIPWRAVIGGLALQILLAVLLLKIPASKTVFLWLNQAALALQDATTAGTSMLFGFLGGGPLPYEETTPGGSFTFAFRALPLVLIISALSALLFHWRLLPWLVRAVSAVLQKTLGIGGAVGVGAAANIFIGMVEAPLLVRPYLAKMSRSELFVVMTCGMATIAGTVLFLYATILQAVLPDALGHLLTASLISAPAAILVAQLMVPSTGELTEGGLDAESSYSSSMDAVTQGTVQGVKLLLNIIALMIVLVALVSLANQILGIFPDVGEAPLSLQRLLGWVLAPIAWLIGIPWSEAVTAGGLIGTKTILNEFVAYLDLAAVPSEALAPRSRLILAYALCGFANLGSLGIMLGGLCTMVPERRTEVIGLGFKSIVAGTLATCMTGALVGVFL